MTFISLLIVCSASWVIKSLTDEYFKWSDWETTDDEELNVYITSVYEDTNAAYFTAGNHTDVDTGKTYYVYDGSSKEPRLTLDGANTLYGHLRGADETDDAFLTRINAPETRPYTVQWEAGSFFNTSLNQKMRTDAYAEYRGVIAGTHYYRIIDTETASVVCYKHAVVIAQDELVDAKLSADRAYIVGHTITGAQAKWTTKNEANTQEYTANLANIPITENLFEGTAQVYAPPAVSVTTASARVMSGTGSVAEMRKEVFKNNYSNWETQTATFSYEILATCYVGSTYYPTLCEAIANTSSGTIYASPSITYGGKTYTAAHTAASGAIPFTHQIAHDETHTHAADVQVKSNVKLIIPYEGTTYDTLASASTGTYAYKTPATYCKNRVDVTTTLTILSGGSLYVGGTYNPGGSGAVSTGQTCGNYAQMTLGSGGKIITNGTLQTFGFIVGTKSYEDIVFNSGAKLMMPFILYEFRGGSISMAMQKTDGSNEFWSTPFLRFTFQNIDGAYRIYSGATAQARASLSASGQTASADAEVISSTSDQALIKLSSGAYVDILYDSKDTLDNYCGKMSLKFYGGAKLNSLDITKTISIMTITVSSKGAYLPISYLHDIELVSGSFDLSGQNIKILPGGSIKVGKDATVTAANIISYENTPLLGAAYTAVPYPTKDSNNAALKSKFIVDGTVTVNNLGGHVYTENINATLNILKNAYVNDSWDLINEYSSNTDTPDQNKINAGYKYSVFEPSFIMSLAGGKPAVVYYQVISDNASGYIASGGKIADQDFTTAGTYTVYDSDASATTETLTWHYQDDISVYYYDANGNRIKIRTANDVWSEVGLTLTPDYLGTPTACAYYSFGGWYTDQSCTNALTTKTIYADTDIYAKWVPIEYKVNVVNVYPEGAPVTEANKYQFKYSDGTLTLPTLTHDTYEFRGWYSDQSCSNQINTLDASMFDSTGAVREITIYLKWISDGYTFTFKNYNDSSSAISDAPVTLGSVSLDATELSASLTPMSSYMTDAYKSNTANKYFFKEWVYTNGNVTLTFADGTTYQQIVDALAANGITDRNIGLSAIWTQKVAVTYRANVNAYTDVVTYGQFWYVKGATVNLPNLKTYDANTAQKYYFASWDLADATPGGTYSFNSDCVVNITWGTKATINIQFWDGTLTVVTATTEGVELDRFSSSTNLATATDYYFRPGNVTVTFTNTKYTDEIIFRIDGADKSSPYTGTIADGGSMKVYADSNEDGGGCFTPDTLITLADGTQKRVDELAFGDKILAWDFFTGTYVEKDISLLVNHGEGIYRVANLVFSDGTTLRLIADHGVFDYDLNRFVYINVDNMHEYVGHRFVQYSADGSYNVITLTEAYETEEHTTAWSVSSSGTSNAFASGLLTVAPPEDFYNWIEMGGKLTYDVEQFQKDIETYGLYTYDDFKDYVTYEQFIDWNGAYLKIAVEKGYFTFEYILELIELYQGWMPGGQ